MLFEYYIFPEFYTLYDAQSDPNKIDVQVAPPGQSFPYSLPIVLGNGQTMIVQKGTQERFVEVKGSELDDTLVYVRNIPTNLQHPKTLLSKYIAFSENNLGYLKVWDWSYFSTHILDFRRHLRAIMPKLYQIRSTKWCYDVMFSWLGLAVTFTPDFTRSFGMDNPNATWDDPVRTLDSWAYTYTDYTTALTGVITLTPDILKAIETIIIFNQDVDANLTGITYNAVDIHSSFNFDPEKVNFKF